MGSGGLQSGGIYQLYWTKGKKPHSHYSYKKTNKTKVAAKQLKCKAVGERTLVDSPMANPAKYDPSASIAWDPDPDCVSVPDPYSVPDPDPYCVPDPDPNCVPDPYSNPAPDPETIWPELDPVPVAGSTTPVPS